MQSANTLRYFMISFLFLTCCTMTAQEFKHLTTGNVQYIDSRLEKLIPRENPVEVIASGFQHIEGPLWLKDSACLLFSDTKASVIYRWSAAHGISKFLEHTGYTGRLPYSEEPGSNGLTVDKNGHLFICEHGDRRIASYTLDARYGLTTLTDKFEGRRYNSPNDIAIKEDGTIIFSDPPYGLPQKNDDPLKEGSVNGVYVTDKSGMTRLLISDLLWPNGLAFSNDQKQLFVSVSDTKNPHINVYSFKGDGSVDKGKLFFDASALPRRQPMEITDGLKVDREGNVWASGPGGLLIIAPDGKLIGTIHTDEIISNCAWGDDGSSLYITAGSFLYRIKTSTKGAAL